MTGKSEWEGRVGRKWAAEWEWTDRSFGALTDTLIERTRKIDFTAALDVGCGAGELALALARTNEDARVLGADISGTLLSVAQQRGQRHSNLEFVEADAARWAAPADFVPDLIVSRHGVMFFGDPQAAFTNLAHQAAAEATLLFSCFRARADNSWAVQLDEVAGVSIGLTSIREPGPFAFADEFEVTDMLEAAGWAVTRFEPVDYAMVVGTGPEAAMQATRYFRQIGPAAKVIADAEGADKAAALARLDRMIALNSTDQLVAMGAAAWIVEATKAR